jgi:hypothetical protein
MAASALFNALIVIGMKDHQLKRALFAELNAIHVKGRFREVDLILIEKNADGSAEVRDVSELSEEESAALAAVADDLTGLLTAKDIEQLAAQIPPKTSGLVVLFEHTSVTGLTETVRKGGGSVIAGGMVAHDVLAHVKAELAAVKEAENALRIRRGRIRDAKRRYALARDGDGDGFSLIDRLDGGRDRVYAGRQFEPASHAAGPTSGARVPTASGAAGGSRARFEHRHACAAQAARRTAR